VGLRRPPQTIAELSPDPVPAVGDLPHVLPLRKTISSHFSTTPSRRRSSNFAKSFLAFSPLLGEGHCIRVRGASASVRDEKRDGRDRYTVTRTASVTAHDEPLSHLASPPTVRSLSSPPLPSRTSLVSTRNLRLRLGMAGMAAKASLEDCRKRRSRSLGDLDGGRDGAAAGRFGEQKQDENEYGTEASVTHCWTLPYYQRTSAMCNSTRFCRLDRRLPSELSLEPITRLGLLTPAAAHRPSVQLQQ
jgi:hypothetical protein